MLKNVLFIIKKCRLLKSIHETDFENDADKFDVEIHVDKSVGLHYQECVE
jgi:hypothetical protein